MSIEEARQRAHDTGQQQLLAHHALIDWLSERREHYELDKTLELKRASDEAARESDEAFAEFERELRALRG